VRRGIHHPPEYLARVNPERKRKKKISAQHPTYSKGQCEQTDNTIPEYKRNRSRTKRNHPINNKIYPKSTTKNYPQYLHELASLHDRKNHPNLPPSLPSEPLKNPETIPCLSFPTKAYLPNLPPPQIHVSPPLPCLSDF